ncbi:hypothetical protein [Actinoplanes sp. NPDC051851]|uniref:hypothetical protein n=1 Tax=Actinoplanes sp. NPDC051851 TaxID=3154753 RepID=UPI00341EFD29
MQGTAALRLDPVETESPATPRLRVAPPLPIRAPRAAFAAGMIALVLVGVLGILLINTKTMEQSFRLDALRKSQADLDKEQQQLNDELIEASSPGNLAARARQLGLVAADSPAMIRLPDGKIIRTPTPGKGSVSVTAQDSLETGAADTPSTGTATAGADATGTGTTGTGTTGATGTGTGAVGTGTTGQQTAGTGQ